MAPAHRRIGSTGYDSVVAGNRPPCLFELPSSGVEVGGFLGRRVPLRECAHLVFSVLGGVQQGAEEGDPGDLQALVDLHGGIRWCGREGPGRRYEPGELWSSDIKGLPVITDIHLDGFKAFKSLDLEIRPITVLLGPNNTGKSSIISSIRLLAQTLQAADPSITLLLDGAFGDFGTFRDIVFGNKSSSSFQIGLSGTSSGRPFEELGEERVWHMTATFGYRSRRKQLVLSEIEISDEIGHVLTGTYVPDSDRHVVTRLNGKEVPKTYRGRTAAGFGLNHFLPYLAMYRDPNVYRRMAALVGTDEIDAVDLRADWVRHGVSQALNSVEYLGGMRVPPERTYHQTGQGTAHIGATGENWTGMLVLDSSRSGRGSKRLQAQIGAWLRRAGLASEIKLNWLSDRHYEIQIRHPITREVENLADVGQGNSQAIPVLLGGLRLRGGSLYMVEEPEIHLHPQAQAELADFFVSLRKAGVNSIIETHSEYLVIGLQQQVAAGKINPNDVAFYYTSAARRQKRAKLLTLDRDARFEQSLDGGFFPQRLEEARKLARLRA